jgi:hypothetical protein
LALPKNERWAFTISSRIVSSETPETEGTVPDWKLPTQWVLTLRDQTRVLERVFPEVSFASRDASPVFGVEDGSKIIRFGGGMAEVIFFETRPVPPLRWKITLPNRPEKMRDREAVEQALTEGKLSLMLYLPIVNPLTGKTIAPDRTQPKSVLRVLSWTGTEA